MAGLVYYSHISPEEQADSDRVCKMDRVWELLNTVVNCLVDSPHLVRIEKHEYEDRVVYRVLTSHSEMGQLIGKQGTTGASIRHIIKAASQRFKCTKFVYLEIASNDPF